MALFNNVENECVNLPDGREVWLSRSCAVVAGIFLDVFSSPFSFSRNVLLVQRGPGCPDNVGKWCMPCGYLDNNETLAEAAIREVYEETGLYLPDLPGFNRCSMAGEGQPVFVNSTPSTEQQNVSHFFTMKISVTSLDRPPVLDITKTKNPGEVSNLLWVPIQDIPLYDMAYNHTERIKLLSRCTA